MWKQYVENPIFARTACLYNPTSNCCLCWEPQLAATAAACSTAHQLLLSVVTGMMSVLPLQGLVGVDVHHES